MKRLSFLGAAAATSLTACGGGGSSVLHAISAVAPIAKGSTPTTQAVQLVPAAAPVLSAAVLAQPIIGEAARFDGTTIPAGWLAAQGQTLKATDYPQLFSMLKNIAGGDGKTTFALPKPPFTMIVAVAGLYPASPQTIASSARRPDATAKSLGPGAMPAPIKAPQAVSAQLTAQRSLVNSAVRASTAAPVPIPWQTVARYQAATADARDAALATLGPVSRGQFDAAIQSASGGGMKLGAIVRTMASTLGGAEIDALNRANAAYIQQFNPSWALQPGDDPRLGAANFLVSVAVTKVQAKAIAAHE
jgi:microcystin-dependent protein